MDTISSLFVGRPWVQLGIGGFFFIAYYFSFRHRWRNPRILLLPALLWLGWAAWEWTILRVTPEANIRVDLLLILPVVLIVSLITIAVQFRGKKDVSESG